MPTTCPCEDMAAVRVTGPEFFSLETQITMMHVSRFFFFWVAEL